MGVEFYCLLAAALRVKLLMIWGFYTTAFLLVILYFFPEPLLRCLFLFYGEIQSDGCRVFFNNGGVSVYIASSFPTYRPPF